jgi:hypothetical protein
MSFHKVVTCEIERDRSLKVFKLFAECIRETGQSAAMHLCDMQTHNNIKTAAENFGGCFV